MLLIYLAMPFHFPRLRGQCCSNWGKIPLNLSGCGGIGDPWKIFLSEQLGALLCDWPLSFNTLEPCVPPAPCTGRGKCFYLPTRILSSETHRERLKSKRVAENQDLGLHLCTVPFPGWRRETRYSAGKSMLWGAKHSDTGRGDIGVIYVATFSRWQGGGRGRQCACEGVLLTCLTCLACFQLFPCLMAGDKFSPFYNLCRADVVQRETIRVPAAPSMPDA